MSVDGKSLVSLLHAKMSMRTPKRKADSLSRRTSTSGLATRRRSTRRRSSFGTGSRKRARRRDSEKWNVKADDPDVAKFEVATVPTTQPPLSKSALKRKYSQSMVDAIDIVEEAQVLLKTSPDKWNKIVTCLERIRAHSNAVAQDSEESAHKAAAALLSEADEKVVLDALSHTINAQRSAIPRHALNTLHAFLSTVDPVAFPGRESARSIVLQLLKTAGAHDKKFIKAAATRCLTEATNRMRGSSIFAGLFTSDDLMQHRNRNIVNASGMLALIWIFSFFFFVQKFGVLCASEEI